QEKERERGRLLYFVVSYKYSFPLADESGGPNLALQAKLGRRYISNVNTPFTSTPSSPSAVSLILPSTRPGRISSFFVDRGPDNFTHPRAESVDTQRRRNHGANVPRDKDLSLEMRRRDKIQRLNEESQGVSLRPSRVVISETSTVGDSQDRIRVMKTQMRSRIMLGHLRYRTAGRVHNNTSWNTSRHSTARRCENRSCVTTEHWFSNGIAESHDCPSLLCLPQAWISGPRRCPSRGPREHVREDARRFRERHEPPLFRVSLTSGHRLQGKKSFVSLATLLPSNDGLPRIFRLFSEMKRGLFYLQPTHLPHLVPFFVR
ncbi:hypothetical protein ALC62_15119, partial [Cyphomyrmex costatus]